jgi:hypothetical protein
MSTRRFPLASLLVVAIVALVFGGTASFAVDNPDGGDEELNCWDRCARAYGECLIRSSPLGDILCRVRVQACFTNCDRGMVLAFASPATTCAPADDDWVGKTLGLA